MANPEHIALLREYSDARCAYFNTDGIQARITAECEACHARGERFDISGEDFEGFYLQGIKLSHVDAQGISGSIPLNEAQLTDVHITVAPREDGEYSSLDLHNASLADSTITFEKEEGADVTDSIKLIHTNVTNCEITGSFSAWAQHVKADNMTLRGPLGMVDLFKAELSNCVVESTPEAEDFIRPYASYADRKVGYTKLCEATCHNTQILGHHPTSDFRNITVTADEDFTEPSFKGNFQNSCMSGELTNIRVEGDFSPTRLHEENPFEDTAFSYITAKECDFKITYEGHGNPKFIYYSEFDKCGLNISGCNMRLVRSNLQNGTVLSFTEAADVITRHCNLTDSSLAFSTVKGFFSLADSTLRGNTTITGNTFDQFEVADLSVVNTSEASPKFRGNTATAVTHNGEPTDLHPDQPYAPNAVTEHITGAGQAGGLAELGEQVREADNPERTPD